ncbi:MAG TPA: hydantoinase B/oxoprolinase family protein [Acidimicrobiia bacterium]|nr:hydantoinase B/oxoprolinase family protein [Acidimicrobiia bacterium]
MPDLDPAALQILVSRLGGVADEMGAVLRRAASSPNIKERADCSAALFTTSGELLVQAEHIPVHLGSMPASVRAAIEFLEHEGGGVRPDDEVILNDPFAGGTHLNDVTLVAPCFTGGASAGGDDPTATRLVGWVATRAHHADVGGIAPGSMPPDATTVDEEGIRLPPMRLTPEVEARFLAASRTPIERRGDLDAQRGANRVGAARLREVVDGLAAQLAVDDAITAALVVLDELLDYGERRMRAAIGAIPDGEWRFDDVLDSAGPRPEQQVPARVTVTMRVSGDRATFDFTGSAAQRAGNVHAVEAVTVSAVEFALRAATDPTIPANGGAMRAVEVIAPPGTVVAATAPAAVGAGNVEVSQRVADVCLGALALALPGAVGAAGQGTMNNVLLGIDAPGGAWVYYETIGGGQGARPWADGMSGVHTAMTNTRDTPVEALERELPVRVRRYGIRRESGGAGAHHGGDGIVRELEVLADATVSLITERRTSRPWGLDGGGPGRTGENWLLPQGDEALARRLPDKVTVELRSGDVVRLLTPGGGGYGSATTTSDTTRPA